MLTLSGEIAQAALSYHIPAWKWREISIDFIEKPLESEAVIIRQLSWIV
jgi:hypothetical protein